MYYRRKIILSLLQEFGPINITRLHKLLFLLSKRQDKPSYSFIPYKYGCYSFLCSADLGTMSRYAQVANKREAGLEIWEKIDGQDYISLLKDGDRELLIELRKKFYNIKYRDLISYVYRTYPYYATRSEIAEQYVSNAELGAVQVNTPHKVNAALFTIGYEGKDIDEFVNILIQQDVKVLCDVRKNALSMKYGFSKKQLKEILNKSNIRYVHIPELGIESGKRKTLRSKEDYSKLFYDYSIDTIPKQINSRREIIKLIKQYDRVALMCFEANHLNCHRHTLAKSLKRLKKWNYEQIDI